MQKMLSGKIEEFKKIEEFQKTANDINETKSLKIDLSEMNKFQTKNHVNTQKRASNNRPNLMESALQGNRELKSELDWTQDKSAGEHYNPSVRLLKIEKSDSGACGFHLTRSKWDPYPWVSAVDAATPAALSGLEAGDCVLEVNGEDVLGLRIKDIAELVKEKSENVTLLLWSTGMSANCDPESLCCGPMPLSLQRLSVIMQNILSIIECPVCLDTIPPPAMQCQNGHLLCVNCRIRAEKCPVCRDRYTPRRALIAEQIYTAITNAFNLCSNEDKLRQKLFGPNAKQPPPTAQMPDDKQKQHSNGCMANHTHADSAAPTLMRKNKFLTKLWGKACSMDNLASAGSMSNGNGHGLLAGTSTPSLVVTTAPPTPRPTAATKMQSATNQLHDTRYAGNHLAAPAPAATAITTTTAAAAAATSSCMTLSTIAATSSSSSSLPLPLPLPSSSSATSVLPTNNVFQANSTFKHFSLSTNDLSLDGALIAIERCPSRQRLGNRSSSSSRYFPHTATATANIDVPPYAVAAVAGNDLLTQSLSPLFLDRRRPCSSLNASVECIQKGLRAVETACQLNVNSNSSSAVTTSSSLSSTAPTTSLQSSMSSSSSLSSDSHNKNELLSISSASSTTSTARYSPLLPPTPRASKAAEDLPVDAATFTASTSLLMTLGDTTTRNQSLKPVDCVNELPSTRELLVNRFRCPFNCGKTFNASSKLQRHVKVQHQMPILSFGASSAELALPLQRPLDDAVLLLEIDGDDEHNVDNVGDGNEDEQGNRVDADVDKHVKNDDKRRRTKECWIRLKTTKKDAAKGNASCILASALLPAYDDDCNDFMLVTQVIGSQHEEEQRVENKAVRNKNGSKNDDSIETKAAEPLQKQQEPALLTRSIVRSMETATWAETFACINNGSKGNKNNNSKCNYSNTNNDNDNNNNLTTTIINGGSQENTCNEENDAQHWLPNGNGSLSNDNSDSSSNDLSLIGIIFQNDKNDAQDGDVAKMLLKISVRRSTGNTLRQPKSL